MDEVVGTGAKRREAMEVLTERIGRFNTAIEQATKDENVSEWLGAVCALEYYISQISPVVYQLVIAHGISSEQLAEQAERIMGE